MEIAGRVVVVTGGASGIGQALARRFGAEGAAGVVVADLDADGAAATAAEIAGAGGTAISVATNVAVEAEVVGLVERAEDTYGPIDLFCANAGIGVGRGPETPNDDWERIWQVNTMSHVYAARALLPGWLARGDGYFLATASAAGLLTQIGSAPYAVTKHAAVAFAEWLAVTYGDEGIKVSCLCPQGVRTNMLRNAAVGIRALGAAAVRAGGDVLEPEQVADAVVAAIAAEQFLVLPHPEVLTYWQRKTADYDRWIRGMRRLQARVSDAT